MLGAQLNIIHGAAAAALERAQQLAKTSTIRIRTFASLSTVLDNTGGLCVTSTVTPGTGDNTGGLPGKSSE